MARKATELPSGVHTPPRNPYLHPMNFLFKPTDIAPLIFFRVAFGILSFIDVLNSYLYYHLEKDAFNPERFQFPYYGFEWVQVFPDPWMTLFFAILLLLAIAITLGYRYRLACSLFFLGFTYLFLLEKASYLNHAYLFCWICFVMIFLPADRAFSWDVKQGRQVRWSHMPSWPLFLLQFLMGVVYFFGGIAKINPDWLRAMPLQIWLPAKANVFLIGDFLKAPASAYFMAYGGLFLDLMIVPLLLFRKTRVPALLMAIFFHFTNALVFNIGIFPYLSLCLTAMYFAPNFPRRTINSIVDRWPKRLGWMRVPMLPATPINEASLQQYNGNKSWQVGGISLLIAIHVLLPLRHHLFPGNVAWTEEGHRYAWRMMLRSKAGAGVFVVEDLATGEKERIQPRDYLWYKQERKMYTHPDMILQFAHFLQKEYEAKGKQVAIYADIQVKLNDHPKQRYIDPARDLTQIQWKMFEHSDWILEPTF